MNIGNIRSIKDMKLIQVRDIISVSKKVNMMININLKQRRNDLKDYCDNTHMKLLIVGCC